MCAYPEPSGKEEEPPCWPSRPLAGLVVAEQERCCVVTKTATARLVSQGGEWRKPESQGYPAVFRNKPTEHLQE